MRHHRKVLLVLPLVAVIVTVPPASAAIVQVPVLAPAPEAADGSPYTREITLRSELGLVADPQYIAALHDAADRGLVPRSGVDLFSILMTPAEEAEVALRQEISHTDGAVIDAYMRQQPVDLPAGVVIDNQAGGTLTVLVTRDADRVRAELLPRLAHPERLHMRQAAFPSSSSPVKGTSSTSCSTRCMWAGVPDGHYNSQIAT